MIGAVVLAGGQGKRMQAGINKQYLEIEGRSVLSLAIESMAAVADGLIVVCAHGEEAQARAAVRDFYDFTVDDVQLDGYDYWPLDVKIPVAE